MIRRILRLAPLALLLVMDITVAQTVRPTAAGPATAQAGSPMAPAASAARSSAMQPTTPPPPPSSPPVPPRAPVPVPVPVPVPEKLAIIPAPASLPALPPVPLPNTPAMSMPLPAQPGVTSGVAPVFVAPAFNPAPAERTSHMAAFEPGQVLVLWLTEEMAIQGVATLQQRYQLRPRQRYSLANLGFTVAMFALPVDSQAQAMRQRLRAEQPDWIVDLNARSLPMQAQAPTGGAAPRLYAQQMLGGANLSRPAVPILGVGVVDTGLDPALLQPAALNGSRITLRSVLGPVDKPADTAHGNAVLQLLAGASHANGFAGAAPPVRLAWVSAVREVNGQPVTNSLALALALDWLLGQQVSMINVSLGGQGDEILRAVVKRVLTKNVALLAAAGNNPAADAPPVFPAAYPGVWAVTAIDAAGQLYVQASRASYVTLAAPGVEIWVPTMTGAGAYLSGTSYATALASAALAWQAPHFWTLAASLRREQVCAQARKLEKSSVPGCGLVQKNPNPTAH